MMVPRWDQIRLIGQSRVVGLTMLVPFIGYLLLFNDSVLGLLFLSTEILGTQELEPVRTISRLYYLYFGLTFVGIASLIYQGVCPQAVKEHGNEYSYVSGESELMTHTRFSSLVNPFVDILEKGTPNYEELERYVTRYRQASVSASRSLMNSEITREELRSETQVVEKKAFVDTLSFHWRYICTDRLVARAIVSGFYLVGFALVLFPSIMVFIDITYNLVSPALTDT